MIVPSTLSTTGLFIPPPLAQQDRLSLGLFCFILSFLNFVLLTFMLSFGEVRTTEQRLRQ